MAGQRHMMRQRLSEMARFGGWVAARAVACAADAVMPPRCFGCDIACGGGVVCDGCAARLEALAAEAYCGACGQTVPYEAAPCPACEGRGVRPLVTTVRLGAFHEPLRPMVLAAKFAGRWPLLEYLADRLVEQPAAARLLAGADALVPVPLPAGRHIGRGYNQAAVLASALGRRTDTPVLHALRRSRYTAPQSRMPSRTARRENVRRAFALDDPRHVGGQHVVLVDDVTTTGSTVSAAARALLPARPASLSLAVLAVADPPSRPRPVMDP